MSDKLEIPLKDILKELPLMKIDRNNSRYLNLLIEYLSSYYILIDLDHITEYQVKSYEMQ